MTPSLKIPAPVMLSETFEFESFKKRFNIVCQSCVTVCGLVPSNPFRISY